MPTSRFNGKPQVEGSIESTIRTTYWHLGIYPEAKQHLARALDLDRAALGHDNPVTLAVGTSLGETYRGAGNYAQSEALLGDTYQTSLRSRGADDPQTLNAARSLAGVYVIESKYAEAEPMLSDLLERTRRVLGADSENTLDATDVLARVYFTQQNPRRRTPLAGHDHHPEARIRPRASLHRRHNEQPGCALPARTPQSGRGRTLCHRHRYPAPRQRAHPS
jgi:hypothetical protein